MSNDRLREAIRLYDRFTHDGMDRRAFMARLTRLAGGAAAANALLLAIAADPASAQIVPEDDPRVKTGPAQWPVAGGRAMSGYMAAPEGDNVPRPVVIVVHENRGLHAHIRDVARRLALAGYVAVAPDWLSTAGGTPADEDRAREMISALDMGQAVADGVATIRNVGRGRMSTGKVGLVGFCWGGAMVNRLAVAAGNLLSAGVVFYGPAPSPAEAPRVAAPLLIHLAERDQRVNATALPWVVALRNAGKDVRAINYHGVDHAFHNDTSQARYNAQAARRAWATTLDFFNRHLRAGA